MQTLLALPVVYAHPAKSSINQRPGYRVLPLVQQMRTAQTRRPEHDPKPGPIQMSGRSLWRHVSVWRGASS